MHLTRDAIRELLTAPERATASDHLVICPECDAVADEVALDVGLEDSLAWELAGLPELPRGNAENPLEAHATARISAGASAFELVHDPRLGTDDGLLALLRAAHELLNVDPERLRKIADAVLALATADGVAVVGHRERANALRRLGELPEALATIARGREVAERLVVSEHELAIFDYIEATVTADQSSLEAARVSATRALATFVRFGDTRRALYARLFLALLDYQVGAFAAARTVFRSVVAPLEAIADHAASVGAMHNAGDCSLQLGEFDTARRELLAASRGYRQLGLTTELLRLRWLLARVAREEGRLDEAEDALGTVARDLETTGLKLDAALVRLDLVELFQRSDRHDEAARLARALAAVFASAGARGRLADALTILREAVDRRESLDEPLREVRAAVSDLIASSAQA